MKLISLKLIALLLLPISAVSCVTTSDSSFRYDVKLSAEVDPNCQNLGYVTSELTKFEEGKEDTENLLNFTANKGGDTLQILGENIGIAYKCDSSKLTSEKVMDIPGL